MRRTGDRVGDALEMRTRRVGVDGFVASLRGGERSISFGSCPYSAGLFSFPRCRLPASSFFFAYGCPLGSVLFWAAKAFICGELTEHYYACTTSRCPVFNWARLPIFELDWNPHSAGGAD